MQCMPTLHHCSDFEGDTAGQLASEVSSEVAWRGLCILQSKPRTRRAAVFWTRCRDAIVSVAQKLRRRQRGYNAPSCSEWFRSCVAHWRSLANTLEN